MKNIRHVANQKAAPVGETRWFCSSCMRGFNLAAGVEPTECPKGHPVVVEDELATVG